MTKINIEISEINKRFQQFREELIADVYKKIVESDGEIGFSRKAIEMRFPSQIGYSDVFGEVIGISLTAKNDTVQFKYEVPEWSEDNRDYIEEGSGTSVETVDLSEMSADELYNVLSAINQK